MIRSEPEIEFLSVTYTDDKKWHAHFKRKIAKAKIAFNMVNGAGLIGGSNIDSDSLLTIRSKILPVLHSGCTATDISKGYKSLRRELRKCYLTWIRTVIRQAMHWRDQNRFVDTHEKVELAGNNMNQTFFQSTAKH